MNSSKHALVTLFAILAAGTVSAQSMSNNSGYYGEIGYSAIKLDDGAAIVTPKLARLIVGTTINTNLDVEGMIAVTMTKADWKIDEITGKASAKHFGLYAKPKFEIAPDTEVFGRIGISRTSWKSETATDSGSDAFTKLAYGIGIQTQFNKDVYGQIDYMNLGKKEGVSVKGFTFSIGTHF